jgi:hypothetical protein
MALQVHSLGEAVILSMNLSPSPCGSLPELNAVPHDNSGFVEGMMMEMETLWGLAVIAGPVLLGLALAYAMIIRPRRNRRKIEQAPPPRDL